MKLLIRIILTIGLLVLTGWSALFAKTSNDVLIKEVLANYNLDTVQFKVRILSDGLRAENVKPEELTVTSHYDVTPLGRFTVVAEVTRNGKQIEKRQVRLFIHKFADVMVVNEKVGRFSELRRDIFSIERRDVTDLREKPITSLYQITGQRARRNLLPGTILTVGHIERIPVVSAHSEVHIIYAQGLFRVTSEGRALQDGQVGEYIKVKSKSSGKTVIARVIDSRSVAVDP